MIYVGRTTIRDDNKSSQRHETCPATLQAILRHSERHILFYTCFPLTKVIRWFYYLLHTEKTRKTTIAALALSTRAANTSTRLQLCSQQQRHPTFSTWITISTTTTQVNNVPGDDRPFLLTPRHPPLAFPRAPIPWYDGPPDWQTEKMLKRLGVVARRMRDMLYWVQSRREIGMETELSLR
jgi:hypothetical protein